MTEILNWPLLSAFIPTFALTSISPGMCMTLSLSLGMAIGVRRTLWMMLGELIGVGLVATAAMLGVAALMLNYPTAFTLFRVVGGAYLVFLGLRLWRPPQAQVLTTDLPLPHTRRALAAQGFVTAAANPKGWAFCIALLPPFIDQSRPLAPQMSVLLALLLLIEFGALLLYAHGGQALSRWMRDRGHRLWLDRVTGALLVAVGIWLALG